MYARILILISFLIAGQAARATDHVLPFIEYDISDGLSNNTVYAIMQDKVGFVWMGTATGLDRFDGVRFKHYELPRVTVLSEDEDGEIWIGTSFGLYLFSSDRKTLERFVSETDFSVRISSAINDIEVDTDGNIWIATEGQGVFLYDKKTGTLSQFSRYISIVTAICLADEGSLLVCAEAGQVSKINEDGEITPLFTLSSYDNHRRDLRINYTYRNGNVFRIAPEYGNMLSFTLDDSFAELVLHEDVRSGIKDITGCVGFSNNMHLVGSTKGLFLCDFERGWSRQVVSKNTGLSFSRHVTSLVKDRENGIWIGTNGRGVYYIPYYSKPVEFVDIARDGNPYAVTCFASDPSGGLLVGTQEGGLFSLKQGSLTLVNGNIQNIQCMLASGRYIIVGTSDNGIYLLDGEGVRNFRYDRYDHQSIMANNVQAVYQSADGAIWVGTEWGLCRFNINKGTFVPVIGDAGKANITDIHEDAGSRLWVGTSDGRVLRTGPWRRVWYSFGPADVNVELGKISCIHEDLNGMICVGSDNGLFNFDAERNAFVKEDLFFPDGNVGSTVSSIEQDANGNLWLSGPFGVIGLDVPQNQVGVYLLSRNDHGGENFISNSSFRTEDGMVCFGGTGGFCMFRPESFVANRYSADVVISKVDVNGRPVDDEDYPVNGKMVLANNENTIAFGFSVLSWQDPAKNRYRYKLEGWDDDWIFAGEMTTVKYENLPWGSYCFMVSGANADGVDGTNVAEYPFIIRPPWYLSWYAVISYVLLVCAVLFLIQNRHRRSKERLAFESRLQSYTNFAQDVRVPVTLIKTPLQNMLSSYDLPDHVRMDLETMKRSADNLLDMIDQLLDYSNNDRQVSELHLRATDMVSLLEGSVLRSKHVADTKGISIDLRLPEGNAVYEVDEKAMMSVLGNLLSNAVKYAEHNIIVCLDVRKDGFEITISNDGPSVQISEQEKIFSMFYQAEGSLPGTGMGLAFARMLVERHGGELKMIPAQSGAAFGLFIPQPQLDSAAEVSYEHNLSQMEKILVLDDSHEIRKLMASILSPYYHVLSAPGGESGFELLESNIINLIICDVDMSDMSGFDFCLKIRSDHRFMDIPLIFITAKVNMKDKVRGLEAGADDYIEKPFDPEWLKARIRSLLSARSRLKDFYKGLPGVHPLSVSALTNADMEFINKLTSVISDHIADEEFYVDDLAEAMFLSKSSLYRKVKSLLDISPIDYIKKIRLHKAAEMLSKGECAVFEVWQAVGFSSLTYFATCFKKEFGITPSKYLHSLKEGSAEE